LNATIDTVAETLLIIVISQSVSLFQPQMAHRKNTKLLKQKRKKEVQLDCGNLRLLCNCRNTNAT